MPPIAGSFCAATELPLAGRAHLPVLVSQLAAHFSFQSSAVPLCFPMTLHPSTVSTNGPFSL